MKTAVSSREKALALADALELYADDRLRERETHTAKKLAQAMSARRDGYTAKRAAELARAIAALDALPPVLARLKLNKARFIEIATQHGQEVSNGYHGYLVDNGKWRDMSHEALAVRALKDAVESPDLLRRRRLEQLEAKLHQIQVTGFFPTPPEVIRRMVEMAGLCDGQTLLEPSAGKGDILDFVAASGMQVAMRGFERIQVLADYCREKGFAVECGDFLDTMPEQAYDRVLMNPPFENGADMDHVRHAYGHLRPSGVVVAVMSSGAFSRTGKREIAFREWLYERGGDVETLPDGSFAKAFNRTGVSTKLVRLTR